jgi:hypothetical protein
MEQHCIILGIIVVVLAVIRLSDVYRQVWMSWVNAILGLWLIVSPWVYGYAVNAGGAWNSVNPRHHHIYLGDLERAGIFSATGTTPLNVRE